MSDQASRDARPAAAPPAQGTGAPATARRFKSEDLFQQLREVEIDHEGRIYRLRLTQLNKLILTA
ncbi:hemin uptake protein HemP [Noviherbaspirillum suwonense]|jgi:hemin uptake protein HemP|uniref:Hemin uptake protein HemP n=1 Tax=Noviherbaspirillum suwonense TaxID=1224511 RepID=A0ABY1QH58_9BURK|nr:hemin uptake protein HemP [Noviherbaspirillum suwonense]SMP67669.1 Hemin uptake protein HemP [Noviherbaspirillum suwonense]